jgi:hypothetical protein
MMKFYHILYSHYYMNQILIKMTNYSTQIMFCNPILTFIFYSFLLQFIKKF